MIERIHGSRSKRGTTLVEVLVAVALMTLVFLFITAELIQTSEAENLASDHSQTIAAANYLLGVVKGDPDFWKAGDWAAGPRSQSGGEQDACGVAYPAYTDSITAPTWHPLCANTFPELGGALEKTGNGVNAQYMWNVQTQGGDPNVAQLTLWVMTDEGGRNDLYELHATRMNNAAPPSYPAGGLPSSSPKAAPSPSPSTGSPSPPPTKSPSPKPTVTAVGTATPSPTPKPSPTPTPSPTPKPSPTPTGIFE